MATKEQAALVADEVIHLARIRVEALLNRVALQIPTEV